ncbi:hypothetical protein HAX54_030245, partial [Datura stramonium]|nr:hypothetical protein [Datura stramonium]
YGGGYTPLDAGGAGGRYTLTAEEVRRQEDTPFRLGRSSAVGTSRCLLVLDTGKCKKKVAGTPKMTTDQPTERLPVNLYKYADDKKKKKIQQKIKLRRSTKILYT